MAEFKSKIPTERILDIVKSFLSKIIISIVYFMGFRKDW